MFFRKVEGTETLLDSVLLEVLQNFDADMNPMMRKFMGGQ